MKSVTSEIDAAFRRNRPIDGPRPVRNIALAARKSPQRVLVVDDEPLIRWSICESLNDMGYDVDQASDAASALRAITSVAVPFDIVVLDLRLPDMKDLSLVATVRQLMPGAGVILMTAFGTAEILAEAAALGVPVLSKPFELDELRRLVGDAAHTH